MFTQVINLRNLTVFLVAIACVTASTQLLSFDVTRYAHKNSYFPSKSAISSVNRSFHQTFSVGNWRYQGAKGTPGAVDAYIQIPAQLDMDLTVQHQYLQQVICPNSKNLDLWQKLENVELLVHIYTVSRQKTVSATCANPLSV